MKKLLSVFLCILLIPFTLVASGCHKAAPADEQNGQFFIEHAYYENGCFYYTVANQTSERVAVSSRPQVQRLAGGEWENFYFYSEKTSHTDVHLPFSEIKASSKVDSGIEIPAGEYRVIVQGGDFCAIGYFTVSVSDIA